MIRVAIVEDDPGYTRTLEEYLNRYAAEHGISFDLRCFSDGDEIAEGYRAGFDIIFMDVAVPFLNGMDAAREVRRSDPEVVIIFITNMPQYAIRGCEVAALDYVLKPVSYFAFSQRLERAIQRLKNREQKYIVLPVKGGMRKLEVSDIYYIESQDHELTVHTRAGDFSTGITMRQMEETLSGLHFFRGNNSYLINLEHVDGVQDGCAVVRGELLRLSRPRKNAFLEALSNYMGEVLK